MLVRNRSSGSCFWCKCFEMRNKQLCWKYYFTRLTLRCIRYTKFMNDFVCKYRKCVTSAFPPLTSHPLSDVSRFSVLTYSSEGIRTISSAACKNVRFCVKQQCHSEGRTFDRLSHPGFWIVFPWSLTTEARNKKQQAARPSTKSHMQTLFPVLSHEAKMASSLFVTCQTSPQIDLRSVNDSPVCIQLSKRKLQDCMSKGKKAVSMWHRTLITPPGLHNTDPSHWTNRWSKRESSNSTLKWQRFWLMPDSGLRYLLKVFSYDLPIRSSTNPFWVNRKTCTDIRSLFGRKQELVCCCGIWIVLAHICVILAFAAQIYASEFLSPPKLARGMQNSNQFWVYPLARATSGSQTSFGDKTTLVMLNHWPGSHPIESSFQIWKERTRSHTKVWMPCGHRKIYGVYIYTARKTCPKHLFFLKCSSQ